MFDEMDLAGALTRRDFLKGATAGAVVIGGTGLLTGCSGTAPTEAAAESTQTPTWSFMTPPNPIAEDAITETVETDLVVVGAGSAGLFATLTAAQAGVKVILLEKLPVAQMSRLGFASFDCKLQTALPGKSGVDILDALGELTKDMKNKDIEQRLLMQWLRNSGETADFAIDLATQAGVVAALINPNVITRGWYKEYPSAIAIFDPTAEPERTGAPKPVLNIVLEDAINATGLVDIRYSTPAEQLIVDDTNGRVTGVLASKGDGTYVQVNAGKAVLLSAGGIEGSTEMMQYYAPWAAELPLYAGVGTNCSGDGTNMGRWIGADAGLPPHHVGLINDLDNAAMSAERWLMVNARGERFTNEDIGFFAMACGDNYQPGAFHWTVYDGKWAEEAEQVCLGFGPYGPTPVEVTKTEIANGVKTGNGETRPLVQANTLEELAALMEVPVDTFVATCARYSVLAKKGVDEDFGKSPEGLTTVDTPPFYAVKTGVTVFGTFNGLRINDKMQVLNAEGNVIEGLFAAGNNSAGFFGSPDYNQLFFGLPCSRAATQGRIAAKVIAAL